MRWFALLPFLIPTAAAAPCKLPSVQKPPSGAEVSIDGDVSQSFKLTAKDAGRFATVHASVDQPSDAGPATGDFEGVSIADLLKAAGAKAKDTKAGIIDSTLTARAELDKPLAEGKPYEVTLSYAEASPAASRHPAFVAFRCNGAPISPTLVVPDDLTSDRYVHELSSLTFSVPK